MDLDSYKEYHEMMKMSVLFEQNKLIFNDMHRCPACKRSSSKDHKNKYYRCVHDNNVILCEACYDILKDYQDNYKDFEFRRNILTGLWDLP